MATGLACALESVEHEEAKEEGSRRRKSKLKTFKNLFTRKKKSRELPSSLRNIKLKSSQSISDVSMQTTDTSSLYLPADSRSIGNIGFVRFKAFSHDSIFNTDSPLKLLKRLSLHEEEKMKELQPQLQQNLKFASPSLSNTSKRMEKSSYQLQRYNFLQLGDTGSEDDQDSSGSDSRPLSPLSSAVRRDSAFPYCYMLPVDFSRPPTPLRCLDNSAAKHKIAIKPRRRNTFTFKNEVTSVEEVIEQKGLLKPAEGKLGFEKVLKESVRKEKPWTGQPIQNTNYLNGSQSNLITLHYSWNADPCAEEISSLESDNQSCLGTDIQASVIVSCPNAQSSLTEHKEEEMGEEGVKPTKQPNENLMPGSQSSVEEIIENFEPMQSKTEAVSRLTAFLLEMGMDKDVDAGEECNNLPHLQPVDQKAKDSSDGSDALHTQEAEDGLGDSDNLITLQIDPAVHRPQFSASTVNVETPPEAEKAMSSSLEKHQTLEEVTSGQSVEMEIQLCEGHTEPTALLQGESAISDAQVDKLPHQSALDEKPFHPNEPHHSDLNSSQGEQEDAIFGNLSNPSLEGLASAGSPKVAPESRCFDDKPGDLPRSVKMEETKGLDGIAKAHPKSTPTKPTRFTIASAWQRSLSGSSSSRDSSCPGSTPSSPIRSELFEGMPQLDVATDGNIVRRPECLDRGNGSVGTNLSSVNEWPKEKALDCESPFGVKLRKTQSLIKVRTEQNHHELVKQMPAVIPETSSTLVKEDLMPSSSGKPPQNLTGGAKPSVPKPIFQKKNFPIKISKISEDEIKQQIAKLSGQALPARLEKTSPEPEWIMMAKLKQKGFQDHCLAKEQTSEFKSSPEMEEGGEKHSSVSQHEKKANFTSESLLKKTSTPQALESKSQWKKAPIAPPKPVRKMRQQATQTENELKPLPSLPVSSCNPNEPPWLSLARKKAKAWSEMPQFIQ